MNAQAVKSLKMVSKIDGTKRPTPMMTKQGNSTVLHRGWTETAVATLYVIAQILVFMLKKWTRIVQNEVRGYYGHVVLALSKSTGRLAYTIRAAGTIPGIVIGEILDTTNEVLGVDLVAALSDVACKHLETESSDGDSAARAQRAKVAVKWRDTVGHVLGRPSDGARREQGRQLLRNDPLRQESNARPETSRGKRTSQSVEERTTERVEEPEKRAEIIASTPQPTVLIISEVTYDTLPSYSSRPIASLRPDKMAEWRRAKFFADVVPTVTAMVTDGRHGGTTTTTTTEQRPVTPVNLSGRRKGRYFTMPLFRWNQRDRSQGLATTRSRAWNDIGIHRSGAVPPPPPGPVPFSPGRHGLFACPPPPCSVPSMHGCPGPFAGPPPPAPAPYSHEQPGPFAGLPPPGAEPSSYGHFVSFANPTSPGPAIYSHEHPGPFADPRRFPHGRPEPYTGPPIHTWSTWAHTVSSRPW